MSLKYSKIGLSVLFVLVALFVSGCKSESAFQVNDIVSDPGAYSGKLTVEGIVYAYSQDDAMLLGVMDKKELQCTTPNCNKTLLPVKVINPRPKIGDEIIVSGDMVKSKWGYLLQASAVEIVANHKLGGA